MNIPRSMSSILNNYTGEPHSDLSFLPERMKINKCNELISNMYNKKKL